MKKIRSFIAPVVISVILLLILEVFLRLFFPPKVDSTEQVAAFQHHPEYLVSLKPQAKKRFVRSVINGSDTIYWKTNKHAFRGNELVEGELRIMVYGDSNIQARFSELSHTYPWYLQAYLNTSLKTSVEVINAGVVGFGPDQSLLKFIEEKDIYKPDIVILQIFADNDYGDIIRNKLFTVDDNGGLSKTTKKQQIDPAIKEYSDRQNPFGYLRIMDAVRKLRRSVKKEKGETIITAEKVMALCTSLCKEEFSAYLGESPEIYSHFADHYDIDVATQPSSRASLVKIDLMDNILKEFHEITERDQIELLVLIEPSAVDISKNSYMNYRDLERTYESYDPSNLSRFVENSCRKYEIPYINLYGTFVANNPALLYFKKGNDHWTSKAQQLAAKETSEYLLKELNKKADSVLSKTGNEK